MKKSTIVILVAIVLGLIVIYNAAYTVGQAEQAVIVRFGKVVETVLEPGLHFKTPFVDDVRTFEKRWLEWDGDPNQITTADKRYISIDVFARWRISDLNVFVEKLSNETRAQSRLDDIIDSSTRNVVANHNLIEAIRTTNRQFVETDEEMRAAGGKTDEQREKRQADKEKEARITKRETEEKTEKKTEKAAEQEEDQGEEDRIAVDGGVAEEPAKAPVATIPPTDAQPSSEDNMLIGGARNVEGSYRIDVGRQKLTRLILENARQDAAKLGIELKDVQIKRIDYIESVQVKVFDRMISERRRVAEAFRSQGQGLSAEILGKKERELKNIQSGAYRKSQEIKGRADAKAAGIYATAYKTDPEFYKFLKTLESYEQTIDEDTWLLLTTDADYIHHLSKMKGSSR
jgi:regulator of protease activity HflC (stomatin/prohibitin superfamily)